MSFDWQGFLDRSGVEYFTRGKNIGHGDIGVRCPFCGSADQSHHMSINLEGRGWICRRERSHSGRSPVRLIRALLGCSVAEAREIAGVAEGLPSRGVLGEVEALLAPAAAAESPAPELAEPREFKKLSDRLPSARPFLRYLRGRGFAAPFLEGRAEELGLRYCTSGPFAGRAVILVRMGGRLVTWTGRSISSRAAARYRTLSDRPEVAARDGLPLAVLPPERCLLWYDDYVAATGGALFLCEGPLDALKMRSLGAAATCFFTGRPSRWQVDLLRDLAPRFGRLVVLPDRGAEAQGMAVRAELAALGAELGELPAGVADPGDLAPRTAAALLGRY